MIDEDFRIENENVPIKNRINSIASLANGAEPKIREVIFNALDQIITRSCDSIEIQAKLEAEGLYDLIDKSKLEARYSEIISSLNADIQQVNKFCLSQGLAVLSNLEPDEFAWEIVSEYFRHRTR